VLDKEKTTAVIPRSQRKLISLKSKDFHYFFKNVKKITAPTVTFYIKPNRLPMTRLGMVVRKLHIKKAVKRNRVKRIIRDVFRSKMANFPGYDLVVMVNKPAKEEALHFFRSDLEKQWSKLEGFYQRY